MWLNKKLRLIQTEAGNQPGSMSDRWVVIQLKAGYRANTFPAPEGQRVSKNFYNFMASIKEGQGQAVAVGIYRIVENDSQNPNVSYQIGYDVPADLKVWSYERMTQRLFLGGISTETGTPATGNQTQIKTAAYIALNNAIPTVNGFVGMSGTYSTGDVLIKSWTDYPFKEAGRIYWEPY